MYKTIKQLSDGLKNKEFSSEELTSDYLNRCESHNANLNCFIHLLPEQALKQAKAADHKIRQRTAGPLTGIPLVHKDILCTKGVKTTCGSKMLDNFIAPYDATVVARLGDAGMVTLGKTNMDEFAMGSSNETSFYGPAKNPWDMERVTGGSSGGSAAAVSAGLAPVATGTDTGGSIRQPSCLCGITGLKPTYGRVSRYGMIAYASSLEQCGPMTRTAEDSAIILNAMAGFDAHDPTSAQKKTDDYTLNLNDSIQGLTIGLPKQYFNSELNAGIAEVIQNAINDLKKLGATVKEVELPNIDMAVPAYYVIASAECSSNLSRYDGVHFGYRCTAPQNLNDLYMRSRSEGFGKEVKRRIIIGTYVLSSGYYDAYYLKAQKLRRLIRDDFSRALATVDVILGPTVSQPAFRLNELVDSPIKMYMSDIYTVPANLAGLPAISIPAGFIDKLPIGMQITGNYFAESKLLNIAHQFQQVTDWHNTLPPKFL